MLFMDLLYSLVVLTIIAAANGSGRPGPPPSPGYFPSSKIDSIRFDQGFTNLWGAQNQQIEGDGTVAIWLDKNSGSGFQSLNTSNLHGYFGANVKLQSNYTAGVVTAFYLTNQEYEPNGTQDEIDIEFLGNIEGQPYVLQSNVFVNGYGRREVRHHLWFDPTQDFHHYAFLWNPVEIIFLVDDVPTRWFKNITNAAFPTRPMRLHGSIWDGSAWATGGGRYKVNLTYAPFISRFESFKIAGCAGDGPPSCSAPPSSPSASTGLSEQQSQAMKWVNEKLLVYDYCKDPNRNRSSTPECN